MLAQKFNFNDTIIKPFNLISNLQNRPFRFMCVGRRRRHRCFAISRRVKT